MKPPLSINRRDAMVMVASTGLSVCATDASAIPAVELPATEAPSLARAYKSIFLIGSAITPGQVLLNGAALIKRQFSVVVAENAMKPIELADKRIEGQYNFHTADEMVDFARANDILVRGHTLLWHNQSMPWLYNGVDGHEVTRSALIARIEKYIADVVGHFKGRVFAWDVVNEAYCFDEPGVRTDAQGMRMSRLRQIIGPEFIEIAFRAAAKADPDALLFYNDYETQHPSKVQAIVAMVKDFQNRGIKIDGVGHQAHCSMGHPSVQQLEDAILKIGRLGVTQHVTELDIALNHGLMESKVDEASLELLNAQAQRYGDFFKMFVKHKRYVSAILFWGMDDSGSWLRTWPSRRFEAPLLFDESQRTKPAFWAVLAEAKT